MKEMIEAWLASMGKYALDRLLPAIVLLVIGLLAIRIVMALVEDC